MRYIDEAAMSTVADVAELVPVIEQALSGGFVAAARSHHPIPGESPSTLLLMPAWRPGQTIGVKVITVDPARSRREQHAVNGVYVVLDARSGDPIAILGARTLTAVRTAAISALASSYLARPEASTLLMVGTGNLAPYCIRGYAGVLPIRKVWLWGRTLINAEALAERMRREIPSLEFCVMEDLAEACRRADVISCATSSHQPLILGENIAPGTHINLIGSFTPSMREADDALLARARVLVDTPEALLESGDLIGPCESGALDSSSVRDLGALVQDERLRRQRADEITVFKSVGMGIADLAAAEYFLNRAFSNDSEIPLGR